MTTVPLRTALSNLAPAPTAVLDFHGNTATVNGSSVTLADQIVTDDEFLNTWDAAKIVPGEGLTTTSGSVGGKFAGALLTHIQGLTEYAIGFEFVPGTSALVFDFYEATYEIRHKFNITAVDNYISQPYDGSEWQTAELGIISGSNAGVSGTYATDKQAVSRAFIMLTNSIYAGTLGRGTKALPRQFGTAVADTWTFGMNQNFRLRKIAIYGGVNDITTLSTLGAIGIV